MEKNLKAERVSRINSILAQRTRYCTVVLEDVYKSQNASAVLRTSECHGIQDVHIIENKYEFQVNSVVVKGAARWLTINRYNQSGINNTQKCYQALRRKGYTIVATSPASGAINLPDLPVRRKLALVFGSELDGISQYALENADLSCKIPMYGFTQSYNLSVSVGLCLFNLNARIREADLSWQLNETEKLEVKLSWLRNIIKHSDLLEKAFLVKH